MIKQFYLIHKWDPNSGPGSDHNKEVPNIPQNSRTGTSPSNSLVSYLGHSLERTGSYSSAEVQLVYSIAPVRYAEVLIGWLGFMAYQPW